MEGRRTPAALPDEAARALTAAQEARLRALLIRHTSDPDWGEKADAGLAVMGTPEGRLAMLLFCASGRTLHRLRLLTSDQTPDILEGRGDRAKLWRLARAMRLLKRLLRAGCERRGEVGQSTGVERSGDGEGG